MSRWPSSNVAYSSQVCPRNDTWMGFAGKVHSWNQNNSVSQSGVSVLRASIQIDRWYDTDIVKNPFQAFNELVPSSLEFDNLGGILRHVLKGICLWWDFCYMFPTHLGILQNTISISMKSTANASRGATYHYWRWLVETISPNGIQETRRM